MVWIQPERREKARLIQLLTLSPGKRGCGTHQDTHPAQHLLLLPLTTCLCSSSCPGPPLPAWYFSACLLICLLLGMCPCPVPMCLPARAALSACLALSEGSGCPGLPAHPRPSVFFCSVTLVCLSLASPSAGLFYPGKQDRHVHPSPVCVSWLESHRLRAKTMDREEEEGRGK